MKKLVFAALMLTFALSSAAAVLPIGATGEWTTEISFRNLTSDVVTQRLGHLTFTKPGFDPVVLDSSITLKAGETRRLTKVEQLYDAGLWILKVDPRLEASAFLSYRGNVARFEVNAIGKQLAQAGDGATFYRVAVDPSSNLGTFPVLLNDSTSSAQVELVLYGPDGVSKIADLFVTAAPGVTLFSIPAVAKDGASLKVCHTACGVGIPTAAAALYPFVVVGPNDGGTQSPRYAQ